MKTLYLRYHCIGFLFAWALIGFGGPSSAIAQKQKSPKKVMKRMFKAATKNRPELLAGLCDPMNKGDSDTRKICALANWVEYASAAAWEEYRTAFQNAEITGPAQFRDRQGTQLAKIPFRFERRPGKWVQEEMNMVKRGDLWYLLSF
ncbi:MAG: hypothetical protein AAF570_16420 [Bacteroidota bacterium]